jgi:protein SCO1/2
MVQQSMTGWCATVLMIFGVIIPAWTADTPNDMPSDAQGVDEHLGKHLPALTMTDEHDRPITFTQVSSDGKPILLVPAYYRCPQLCGLVLEATLHAAQGIDWVPGRDYHLLTVSFDSEDRPAQALQKQASVLAGATGDQRFSDTTWPFLTCDASTSAALLSALGEHVERQPDGTLAHPAIAIVLTPDIAISRYLYGITLRPLDLELALAEASAGRSSQSLDRILLFCYRYDPATRRYGLFITRFLQIGGLLTALGGGLGIMLLVRHVRIRAQP